MSDEFEKRDWAEDLNEGIRNRDTWLRGLKIVVLFLFLAAARFVLALLALFQFLHCLFRNRPGEFVRPAGPWLARYIELVILYVTWSSDYAPFPFAPLGEVADGPPDYGRGEAPPAADEDSYEYEDDRYDSEPADLPPDAEDILPEDEPRNGDERGEDESADDGSRPPPRPDA